MNRLAAHRFGRTRCLSFALAVLLPTAAGTSQAATWPMKHRDATHTGRADYVVPADRLNSSFFDTFLWQKPTPGSPGDGNLSSTSMVFFDGAGPEGGDIVVGGYHWPKGVQGMDRHTGKLFWNGNPAGGETIGTATPAFSNDGSVVYVLNDATQSVLWPKGHPLMAFPTSSGPTTFWHNGVSAEPSHLQMDSPTIASDGRIFLHSWVDRPYAGTDMGSQIQETWGAATGSGSGQSDPSLYQDGPVLKVVAAGREGLVNCYDGATGGLIWSVQTDVMMDATVTISPSNGSIYVAGGEASTHVIGLSKDGDALWSSVAMPVYTYEEGVNNRHRAQATGCLSHDASTYYFQTNSVQGDGRLYAVNTADGTVKWSYATSSTGWEMRSSCPIVTSNGVVIVGNNEGGTYYAIRDDDTSGRLLDTLVVAAGGTAQATATLSPDGSLYLPLRTVWSTGNGDGQTPDQTVQNVFTALDLRTAPPIAWPMKHRDAAHTGRADFTVPPQRLNDSFFDVFAWQKRSPGSPGEGNLSSTSMVFFDRAGPEGADIVVGGYHWPKGVQGMDRHTGKLFWNGNPAGGETIGTETPAFSNDGTAVYVVNDSTQSTEWPDGHPLMAFATPTGPSSFRHNGEASQPSHLEMDAPTIASDGRIFLHSWVDRPYAGTDMGSQIQETWAAATACQPGHSDPSLYQDGATLKVVVGSRTGSVYTYDGSTGDELWSAWCGAMIDATVTIDPSNGHIYVAAGADSIDVIGLDKDGNPLWENETVRVFEYIEGENNPQRAQSAGCLSHDGATYYFQTISEQGDGRLYAINTADGSVKWSYATGSTGWEMLSSSPIVTPNSVVIVGNNEGDTYYAIQDGQTQGTLLDTLSVDPAGNARATPTLSPEGLLYLPLRVAWSAGNGDGEAPNYTVQNLFAGMDLRSGAHALLYPPSRQSAVALNNAVSIGWQPVQDPTSQFDHYAIYRDTAPFSSVAGMTPVGTVSSVSATGHTDNTAVNGTHYYYAVTTVALGGGQVTDVASVGPRTPRDETDLQMLSLGRSPQYPRYAPEYTNYEITEPAGFGPYWSGAATSLGGGQTGSTQRWPNTGDTVTYTATIRNRGTNTWSGTLSGTWRVDASVVATPSKPVALAPNQTTTFTLTRTWEGLAFARDIGFAIDVADARSTNNSLTVNTKAVPFLTYVDRSYIEDFRERSGTEFALAQTDDMIDWLQRHMVRFNDLFTAASCAKRVHYNVLEVLDDTSADPTTDRMPYAIFPFRYYATDGDARLSGWYNASDDIDYGLLHEMGHQLGLIDIYQLDLPSEANQVSGLGYTAVDDLMRNCAPVLSPASALPMTHWLDVVHGYYGQYLYGLPGEMRLRVLDYNGQPLPGATVRMYQMCDRPGIGKVISTQIKAQGTTDAAGEFVLPNVPIDPGMVPAAHTGDVLHANPFGYVSVVGQNGLLHFRVEYNGGVDYAFLDITEANIAYYSGQTGTVVFDRQLGLGGPTQLVPPNDMAELNAADWSAWAEGSDPAHTYVQDDTSRTIVGGGSVKFVTNGGFDTYIRYPRTFTANWDVSAATHLNISFYAENPNPSFQNASPWIRLKDADGNYFEYQYYQDGNPIDLLNDARDQWQSYSIPLDASPTEENGWRRTTHGAASLTHIQYVEIHADTWGFGFTLWIDGVGFDPALRLRGDVNGDGHVDMLDLLCMSNSWGATRGQPGFDPACDLNSDASVNVVDLLILADDWGA